MGSPTKSGRRSTDISIRSREFWVRPCPWCEEILEPTQDEDGYWMPGLIGHSCSGYDEEKEEKAKCIAAWQTSNQEDRFQAACRLGGMTERRQMMTFESFDRERQPAAYDKAEHFFVMPQSLIFCGPYGVGKTHLASAILYRWMRTGFEKQIKEPHASYTGGRGLFMTLPRLLMRIRATYKQKEGETEDAIIEHLINVPLLVLDDVGKEKSTDHSRQTLFNVIDGRYVKNRHIIVTSNESVRGLADVMGGAAYSRMAEMGEFVNMKSGDYRAEQSAKRIKHPK